jgi:hypothetical protein
MIDQEKPQKGPRAFDEAIVFGFIAVAIDEILELGRQPSHARRPLIG